MRSYYGGLLRFAFSVLCAGVLFALVHATLPYRNLSVSLVFTAGALLLVRYSGFVAKLLCAGACVVWFALVAALLVSIAAFHF